jgi:hypothetical protein
MDSACSTHRIGAKGMQNVRWEASQKREHYEDLGKDGRIIIIWVYRMGDIECVSLRTEVSAGCCKHGTELVSSTCNGKFLE